MNHPDPKPLVEVLTDDDDEQPAAAVPAISLTLIPADPTPDEAA